MESFKEELLRIKRETEQIRKWADELEDELLVDEAKFLVRDI